mmetsp:Transcript_10658/g.15786  ORF Transcript_10658/g.15786 Transcript_10658/m.15786 type:complete len:105 (+) Transcript_10658:64-378(+)
MANKKLHSLRPSWSLHSACKVRQATQSDKSMCCDAVATDLAWTSQAMIGGAATPSVITALGTPSTRTQGWVAQAQEGLEQKQALRKSRARTGRSSGCGYHCSIT